MEKTIVRVRPKRRTRRRREMVLRREEVSGERLMAAKEWDERHGQTGLSAWQWFYIYLLFDNTTISIIIYEVKSPAKSFPTPLVSLIALFSVTLPLWAAPVTIFEDPFDAAPNANGWTETPDSRVTHDGTDVRLRSTTAATTLTQITRTINTAAFTDLTLTLDAFQGPGLWVGADDSLRIIADGVTVFSDGGVFLGSDGDTSTGLLLAPSPPQSTGAIAIPTPGDGTLDLTIEGQISGATFLTPKDYFLSHFTLSGELIAAVPEMSSFFLLLGFVIGFTHWQTRFRRRFRVV